MDNTTERAKKIQRNFRKEVPDFPPPSVEDRLLFAMTELAGEAGEAVLRERSDYLRSRDKEHNLLREMAQAYMMVVDTINAIEEGEKPPVNDWRRIYFHTIKELAEAGIELAVGPAGQEAAGRKLYHVARTLEDCLESLGEYPVGALQLEHGRIVQKVKKHKAEQEQSSAGAGAGPKLQPQKG